MRGAALLVLALAVAACSSGRSKDEVPSLVPPPDPNAVAAPSTDPRIAELQTSMTELLERLDVLNARLARLESGTPAAVTPAPAPESRRTGRPPEAAETPALRSAAVADNYRNALMLYGRNRFPEARAAFQQVFDADPAGELADNALYWIGETYYATGAFSDAMRYYDRVTREYAEANKAPDALFKTGLTFEKTGDLAMARRSFDDCIRRYPYSTAAASAKQELKRIKY